MEKIKGWAIVIGIALVVGVVGFMLGNMGSTPDTDGIQGTAKNFVEELVAGNVDGTYELGSINYQARNTKDYVKTVSDSLKTDKAEIKDEEVFLGTGSTADEALYLNTVDNLPKSGVNSTKGNFVIRLVKEDGKWKVDSSQIF